MRSVWLVTSLALWSAVAQPAAAAEALPPSVLVLNQSNSYRPWPRTIVDEIRTIMANRAGGPVSVYVEDLDLYRFNGPNYRDSVARYLRDKYRDKPIGAIMPIGSAALDYALQLRSSVFPKVPIVFAAVDRKTADLDILPGVTGITIQLNLADMIAASRALLPETRRFALVGDRLANQLYYSQFAQELVSYSHDYEFIDLTGQSLDDVKQRVAILPRDTVILYIGINADPRKVYASAELVPTLVKAANRPIVVSVETYFGSGAIGGFLLSPKLVGQEAAALALRVLGGEDASTIPVAASDSLHPVFDGRQLERWGINESRLPPRSEVRFRAPGIWEVYRWEIVAVLAIVLFQSLVLMALLTERYRRRVAEDKSRRRVMQVIHLNRTATAGALSASVAHELNQPLGAILNYAETADLLLAEGPLNVPLLKEIIADIRRDDQRASEVIKHLRELLKQRSDMEFQMFDINETINAAIGILEPEAIKRGIALDSKNARVPLPVRADRVQLEQVILNLVANGMDAVSDCAPDRRRLLIEASPCGKSEGEVVISNSGPGIPKDALKKIFEAFYTTKATGTGLGLSIARTIVENSGGRIWAENRAGGGAVFRFTLPLATEPTGVS